MGKFLFIFLLFQGVVFSSYAQYDITLNQPTPDCKEFMGAKLLPLADKANAICRPQAYKSKSRRVRYALSRIERWRNYAKEKWDQEHKDIYQKQDGVMSPPLYPTYSYDQAIVYMYGEWAHECGRFNSEFADAMIELRHLNSRCERTVAYESFQRMWRDNAEVQKIYQSQSGESFEPNRSLASDDTDN